MKKLIYAAVFAALAASSHQAVASVPRHMPLGAKICRECDGDGWVHCGFLYLDSKRCLDCDGRGYVMPKHHRPNVNLFGKLHQDGHRPDAHKPPPPKQPAPKAKGPQGKPPPPPPKGGKGPR